MLNIANVGPGIVDLYRIFFFVFFYLLTIVVEICSYVVMQI